MDQKPHSSEHFGEQRNYWWNRDFLELMSRRWDLSNIKSMLDVGCGMGHWGQLLAEFLPEHAKITGIDREPEWVNKARERASPQNNRFKYTVGLAEKIPFPDHSFDMVTCQTVLIHVGDPKAVLTEMFRVLKPGGLLVVAEPNNCASHLIFDTNSIHEPIEDIVKTIEFHLTCERGKASLGLGFESLGDVVPSYFQQIGLADIQVYLSDKTTPLVPPYHDGEQKIWIKQAKEWLDEDIVLWSKPETLLYYQAGGGKKKDFEPMWKLLKKRWEVCLEAIQNKTYATAGGNILYLISGRKK